MFHWFFVGAISQSHPTSCAVTPGHRAIPFADNSPFCANGQLFSWLFIVVAVYCKWKRRVALGSCLLVHLIVLWKLKKEVAKSLVDSRSVKGSTCQRIAFPLSSQSSPEEGCVLSQSSSPQVPASGSLVQA